MVDQQVAPPTYSLFGAKVTIEHFIFVVTYRPFSLYSFGTWKSVSIDFSGFNCIVAFMQNKVNCLLNTRPAESSFRTASCCLISFTPQLYVRHYTVHETVNETGLV